MTTQVILILLAICNLILIALILMNRHNKNARIERVIISQQIMDMHKDIAKFHSINRMGIQYCLICLRLYLIAIQNKAVDREDYKEAAACKEALNAIQQWLEYKEDQNQNK